MTNRSPNRIIENEGCRYVAGVVENNNSIFQPVALNNDQGNDCYIEFVINGKATNWGVFVQIKSGSSYKDSKGYKIPADKHHLAYWNNPINPMIGIVYDPEVKKAFWVNIAEYIKANQHILHQEYHSIRVSPQQEFSEETFPAFTNHFIQHIKEFKSLENFGRSLDLFACMDDADVCYEGLKSLYSNHRDKASGWLYIISNFAAIKEEGIRRNIIGLLSNYADNPNIFWHANNMQYYPNPEIKSEIKKWLTLHFGTKEIWLLLPYMRDGVSAGSFSHSVFLVMDMIEDAHLHLKKIVFSSGISPDDRNHILWLYMHVAKYVSTEETITTVEEYLKQYPFGYDDEALIGVKESIENGQLFPIG